MPDFNATQQVVERYLKARVPLIVISSIEPTRVMAVLEICAGLNRAMAFYHHSRTEGLKELFSGQTVSDDYSLTGALEQARTSFKTRTNVNFIFTDVEDLDQESSTSRHLAEMVRLAESRQGSIILVVQRPVWSGLSRLGMSAALDLPTTDELFDALNGMVEDHRMVVPIEWQHPQIRQAAEILSGVTEMEAVNVLATMLANGRLANTDILELSEFKDRIFGQLTGIERIKLKDNYQVGGLRRLKEWLGARERLMKADLSQTNLKPPKGVLLVGISGCGKSLSAKAIASQWQLPLYRMDMSGILGMYVGQSEAQLREALETAERVAPCVLWIDEIEKALATGAGDSGTSKRLIGQFLFWMQESTAKVFMVATANDVNSLPPELLRKGRFDELFFVDLPSSSDREAILRLYFLSVLNYDLPPDVCQQLVQLSLGFSGSDIEAVVQDIAVKRFNDPLNAMPSDREIAAFFRNVVPFSHTNAEDVAQMRAWGLSRCVPAGDTDDDLPGASRRLVIV
ncbi:MAG: AAA family ATPase [Dermatophilaceae bacterium]